MQIFVPCNCRKSKFRAGPWTGHVYAARPVTHSESGTILVFAALALMLLILIVGMALEFSRIQHVKSAIVSAGQAAVLSSAKLYMTDCVNNGSSFTQCACPSTGSPLPDVAFKQTYKEIFRINTSGNDFGFDQSKDIFHLSCTRTPGDRVKYDFTVSGEASINTLFLGLFGYSTHMVTYSVHASRED